MIYTITLNPAIDYTVHVDALCEGQIIRGEKESVFFGGKGINVSNVLNELGVANTAMGFVAGFTGDAIEKWLSDKGIASDFVKLENGFSRIDVKIRSKKETDINGKGPDISEENLNSLLKKLDRVTYGDTVVLAGSIPPTVPSDIYERIMKRLEGKNVKFAVDATGDLLLKTLKYRPFLIKPNKDELSEIFSCEISTNDDIVKYATILTEQGAKNVLVSLGSYGAILLDETGKSHYMEAHKGNTVNTVGAGDSMVAGFIAGYEATGDYEYALKLGTAAGSATAFCEGIATEKDIKAIL